MFAGLNGRATGPTLRPRKDKPAMEKRKMQTPLELDIRRRVEAKYEERNALLIHLASYVGVNVVVWAIWLLQTGGFPWPLFVTFFWGIGMVGHALDYYHKHGGGAQKREEQIQEEVQRQLRQMEERENRLSMEEEQLERAEVYTLDNYKGRGLRLSDDGELEDFELVEEARPGEDRQSRARSDGA